MNHETEIEREHGPSEWFLNWDISQLPEAMKIPAEDVRDYFTDGRRVAFLLERRIASQVLSLARSEGAGYGVLDSTGRK